MRIFTPDYALKLQYDYISIEIADQISARSVQNKLIEMGIEESRIFIN